MVSKCTEYPTPTANNNEGSICVTTVNGVPETAIKPIAEIRDMITVNNGRKTPTGVRNKSNSKIPIKPSAIKVKRGILLIISY